MSLSPFSPVLLVALGQLPLQIPLPGPQPGPVAFAVQAALSLLVWAVVVWLALRFGRYGWGQIAARVRYDRRDRE